ncbi:MAG: TrkH family potassium uptake protein [Phocaeicola sp.]
MSNLERFSFFKNKTATSYILRLLSVIDTIVTVVSLLFVATLIYEYGYTLPSSVHSKIAAFYRFVWVIFFVSTSLKTILKGNYVPTSNKKIFRYFLNILLYLTLVPAIFYEPQVTGIIHAIWVFLSHPLYIKILLLALSLLQISKGVFQLLGKHTNPSFIFASSFLVIIWIGTGLLLLPHATYHGISLIDALFTSTSATCVTGLITIDVPATFTPMGQFIIILLIQIGGIGVMTFTCFFALFFMGDSSVYSQIIVRDLITPQSIGSLFSALGYILCFTLVIELCGAGIIFFSIRGTFPQLGVEEELLISLFHSISAFCNAGFSNLPDGMSNEHLLTGHNGLYITLSFLIILGGLGYPVLVNLFEMVRHEFKRFFFRHVFSYKRPKRKVHISSLNTRITLVMTISLLVIGSLLIALLEWKGSFAGLPFFDKCVQAFFNASSPRTAGFSSINPNSFSIQTILVIILLMMIGGGNQSTAGGVKVNVFAVVALNLRTLIVGGSSANIFNRELPNETIRRSNAALLMYLVIAFVGFFLLTFFEPGAALHTLFFEVVSALSTVGLTLNLTPALSLPSKLIVIFLMFVGRVGAFTLLSSLLKRREKCFYKYPKEAIIIN